MTTLIAVHDSDGLVGRCDAHCYNAKHEHCTCVCGGRNHGAGLAQALANVKEVVEIWEERFADDDEFTWQVRSVLDKDTHIPLEQPHV